jgi:hypothetical protein
MLIMMDILQHISIKIGKNTTNKTLTKTNKL